MKKYSNETWVGVFMTIGFICVVYLAVQLGHVSFFDSGSYPLTARFSSVSSLHAGSPVTMMGIDIGKVTDVGIDQKRRQAVVAFRVRNGIQIYGDAIASIKTQGLIGEKYLAIDAGGAENPLKSGGVITDTVPPVDLTDIIGKYAFGSVGNGKCPPPKEDDMRKYLWTVMMLILMFAYPCSAASTSAKATVEGRVGQVLGILGSDSPDAAKKEEIRQLISGFFDFEIMSKLALSYHWKEITDAQRERFVPLYRHLLESAYMDKLLAYKGEQVEYSGETALAPDRAQVDSRIVSNGNAPIALSYRLFLENGKWKVYDLIIENVSLAQNYRSQFVSLLQNESMDQLLKVMQRNSQAHQS